MATVRTFQEIIAWQKGHQLVLEIYKVTKEFPQEEKYRLVDQLCRAGISFPANIAEGFKRDGLHDSLRFYNIAMASLEETKYHLLLAKDLGYITSERYEKFLMLAEECGRLLHAWCNVQQ